MNQHYGMSFPLTSFQFQDIKLKEACWIDKTPYFTRKAIGMWLDYKFPEKSIAKIIERNPHIKRFQVVVKLTTTWGKNNIKKNHEVCDPVGLQLIINKSNQPKAIAFQISAARLVVAYMKGELIPGNTTTEESKDPRQIAFNRFKQIDELPHGEKGSAMKQLAEEFGIAVQTLGGWKTQYQKTGRIEDKRKTTGKKKQIKTMHLSRWKIISRLLDANMPRSDIKKLYGVSDSQIHRIKSKYEKRWFDKNKL
ncbi:MAG: trp operon repressor [Desulfobacula sp.]|nr:trp operon repressor [Desulfobacula sp.]